MSKRRLTCLVVFLLLLSCSAFSYAEENNQNPALIAEVTEIRPESNISVVEDVTEPTAKGEREFLIIESRNGHFFYIVIDRSGNSEKAYFLNQVDEADLIELLKEEGIEKYAECNCDKKCINGAVNPECLVCRLDTDDCKGKSATAEKEKSKFSFSGMSNNTFLIIGGGIGLLVLGIAYVTLQKSETQPSKPKRKKAQAVRIDYDDDDYDDDNFDDYDDDEE